MGQCWPFTVIHSLSLTLSFSPPSPLSSLCSLLLTYTAINLSSLALFLSPPPLSLPTHSLSLPLSLPPSSLFLSFPPLSPSLSLALLVRERETGRGKERESVRQMDGQGYAVCVLLACAHEHK